MQENIKTYSEKVKLLHAISNNDHHFQAFQALPMVKNMNESQAALIFSAFTLKRFQAGEQVYQAGSISAGEVYMLLSGKVNVSNQSGHQYSNLKTGDVFGLFSFLDEQRGHSANITVERDIEVLTLERTRFNAIDTHEPKLGRQLMRFMFQLLSAKALGMEIEYAHMHSFAFGGKSGGKI
ncbi:MAG: cyclic nucleotide-binding domain-containing protein [Mariprofundaceae bacterium]|nr:cyclic nucleotide-binding domain-containing protein [Mariprofundaceae bacterium]